MEHNLGFCLFPPGTKRENEWKVLKVVNVNVNLVHFNFLPRLYVFLLLSETEILTFG